MANFIGLHVRELTFDRVVMPKTAFVKQRRRGRPEAMRRHLGLVVTKPAKGGVQRAVADRTMPRPNLRKQERRRPGDFPNTFDDRNRLSRQRHAMGTRQFHFFP
ncbi:hypothetical protein ABIF50_003172 [Bradyrhizobium diazoefficiens]